MSKKEIGKLQLTRADITSFIALFISMGVLVVTLYQTKIMANQQDVMQQQQEASVYPHLDLTKAVLFDQGKRALKISVSNYGVGLALIEQQFIFIKGKPLNDLGAGNLVDNYKVSIGLSNNLKNNVIPPGQEEMIFYFQDGFTESLGLIDSLYQDFDVTIQYHSIYGKKWEVSTNNTNAPRLLHTD